MAPVTRWLRLPASPIEHSIEGRAFVFSGFSVAMLAIALYGQDYIVPILAFVAAATGHVVSYLERNRKRAPWRRVFPAALGFGAVVYVTGDSALALCGGGPPLAYFVIVVVP